MYYFFLDYLVEFISKPFWIWSLLCEKLFNYKFNFLLYIGLFRWHCPWCPQSIGSRVPQPQVPKSVDSQVPYIKEHGRVGPPYPRFHNSGYAGPTVFISPVFQGICLFHLSQQLAHSLQNNFFFYIFEDWKKSDINRTWSSKSKDFTHWCFIEKVCWYLI